ncbi:conserved hypothetical protein [Sphingomonas sp. T1]|uniref:hypothetical protein n=1 Tax=Sphingomonas sp. T1 TaxID=2653172 RepID=UPI0012F0EBD2|nr:hypothetical protein [Sphingomonas sp. T1]VXD07550.1 conserved hypothetical protein [Sphingomonas sp. T1]
MPYQKLYHKRQGEGDYLPRQWYLDDALELSWVKKVIIKASNKLPKDRARGFVISHGPNFMHDMNANYTIIVAEGMSREMERFVVIKELMHMYFGPDGGHAATGSAVALDNHFRKFFGNSATITASAHVQAEHEALWMALAVICPEHRRLELKEAVTNRDKGFEDVAALLHIPLHTAKALLSKQFESEISHIIK